MSRIPDFKEPDDVRARLEETGYLVDDGLAVACFLALRLHRPLFCEGDAGVGKTALATALAEALGAPLIRLQCHEGIDASQALYDWDFPVSCCICGPPRRPGPWTPTGWRVSCTTAGS